MPIYEYKCRSCGKVSEVLSHGWSYVGNQVCPNCGSFDTEKLLSTPSLVTEKGKRTGNTCCGRTERCDNPPCSSGGNCSRH